MKNESEMRKEWVEPVMLQIDVFSGYGTANIETFFFRVGRGGGG
jgi:hypothetical protein